MRQLLFFVYLCALTLSGYQSAMAGAQHDSRSALHASHAVKSPGTHTGQFNPFVVQTDQIGDLADLIDDTAEDEELEEFTAPAPGFLTAIYFIAPCIVPYIGEPLEAKQPAVCLRQTEVPLSRNRDLFILLGVLRI